MKMIDLAIPTNFLIPMIDLLKSPASINICMLYNADKSDRLGFKNYINREKEAMI